MVHCAAASGAARTFTRFALVARGSCEIIRSRHLLPTHTGVADRIDARVSLFAA
jgi:hypothetical protein